MDKLKVVRKTFNYIYAICPFHDDHNPSLTIALTGPFAGLWRCWACGKHGQAVDLGIDFEISPVTQTLQDWDELQKQYEAKSCYLTPEGVVEKWKLLAKEWGIQDKPLIVLGCGWDEKAYTFPMRNENRQIIGIQRRFPNGRKVCVEGSRLGLFIPNVPFHICLNFDMWLITEGVSDCAVALDMGFFAIGRPSCNTGDKLIQKWLNNCWQKPNKMLIVADNDEVGILGATRLKETLWETGRNCDIFIPPAKDLRQAVHDYGKIEISNIIKNIGGTK